MYHSEKEILFKIDEQLPLFSFSSLSIYEIHCKQILNDLHFEYFGAAKMKSLTCSFV